jgi:hypothetical protein
MSKMKTGTKWLLGIGGLIGAGLGYEYWKSKQPRPQVASTSFCLQPVPGGPANSTYGDLAVWNPTNGAPVNAPKVAAGAFVASLQMPTQPIPEAGYLGVLATWLPLQFASGNRVFFSPTPVGTTTVGLNFYRFTINDPSPPLNAVEIVKG